MGNWRVSKGLGVVHRFWFSRNSEMVDVVGRRFAPLPAKAEMPFADTGRFVTHGF